MTDLRDGREEADDDTPEPAPLRRLRLLVSTLMIVLIAGMITVSAALVIRLGLGGGERGAEGAPALPAPVAAAALTLPAGAEIRAVGRAGGEILIVTRDAAGAEHLRAFDAETGAVRSVTPIRRDAGSGG